MRLNPEEIKTQIAQLLSACPELHDDDVLRHDMFEAETDLHKVLGHIERDRQEAVAMAAAINLWIDELEARAARYDRRNDSFRKLIFGLLQAANLRKVELPEATLSVRNGVPRTIVTDEAALPEDMIRIKREPNLTKIKAALTLGETVPGASLSNADDILHIKVR